MKRLPILFLLMILTSCGFDPLTEAVDHFAPEDPEYVVGDYEHDRPTFEYQYEHWVERERQYHDMTEIEEGDEHYATVRLKLLEIIAQAHNVEWVSDGEHIDVWSSLDEFITRGYKGDCEELAHYFYWLIRKSRLFPDNNVSMRMVDNYFDSSESEYHDIVAILTDGPTLIISNGRLYREKEVHTHICLEYNIFTSWWK